jgi:transcriptional regulator with XRE-family HTH domain
VSKSWAEDQAKRIGKAVRDLRGNRTGQWLSDETGLPRTTISELESGKRKAVSTAELCLLAWALRVPPIRLIYPDLPDGPVEVVPGKPVPSIEAATWFSGELVYQPVLPGPGGVADEESKRDLEKAKDLFYGRRSVELSRRRIELQQRIVSFTDLVADFRTSDNPSSAEHFVEEIATARREIDAIEAELRQLDGAVVGDGG